MTTTFGILIVLFIVKQLIKAEQPPYIDENLKSLVDEWKYNMDIHDIDYTAGFNRIDRILISYDNKVAGHSDKTNREIVINANQLRSGLYSSRAVMYHELGHYVFCLKHNDKISIMYYKYLSETFYKNNWEALQDNYINKCKDKEYEGRY